MSQKPKIVVNGAEFSWGEGGSGLFFYGADSVLFWSKPSLVSLLQPLKDELGEDLYTRLVAYETSKGTHEDFHAIVNVFGKNFDEGFSVWCQAVAVIGWGDFKLEEINWEKKTAVVSVRNAWETRTMQVQNPENSTPFVIGKISGIFSHAFQTNCRAKVTTIGEGASLEFRFLIEPSTATLEDALLEMQQVLASDKEVLRSLNGAFRRSEKRLLDVLDTVGEFVWEADRHLNISYVTDRASEILKIPKDEILGQSWTKFLGEAEMRSLKLQLENLSSTRSFVDCKVTAQIKGHGNVVLRMRIKYLTDFNGNHFGYVGSASDVTQEEILKSQLQEQQKNSEFASKMATLGEMAGAMAHEINTPLGSISLLIEQLRDPSASPEEIAETANSLAQTTDKINKIIQGLRTFARDASYDPKVLTSLGNLISETLVLCRVRLNMSGIALKTEAIPDVKIDCRPAQIMQVLINLINNAVDAVADLSEKWISLEVRQTKSTLQIRVTDSGAGIPLGVREKIMTPFFTTKPAGKGTGMGLSISKGLIESHGGRLFYDDSSAHTCFVIELDLK